MGKVKELEIETVQLSDFDIYIQKQYEKQEEYYELLKNDIDVDKNRLQ